MTTFRSEDVLVGFVALALLPLIAQRVLRGLRQGRLPLYRTYLQREESEAKFRLLLGLHMLSFLLVGIVAADLILGLGLKERL